MKTGKENGRAAASTGPVEEGFDPALRAFGSELRALAQAVHPRVDFVTRLRQDVSAALQSPPPAAVPRLALPKWRRTGAALAVVVGLAVVLAFLLLVVLAPWLEARGASLPAANISHLEIMARVEQLPEGAVTRLGLGQALSLATRADGKLGVGTRDEVCLYSTGLVQEWCAAQDSDAYRLAFSPEGDLLAVGRADGQVVLLNESGEQLGQPIDFGQEPIVGLDWLDGRPMRLAAVTLGATVGVWDVERDSFAWEPMRYGLRASALALERGQNLLALGSDAGVLVLDAETGLLLRREKTDPALPPSLAFDLDGRMLTAALDISSPDQYGLVSWRLSDWMPADSSNIGSAVNTLAGGPGDRMAAVSADGDIWIRKLGQPGWSRTQQSHPDSPLAWSPDGSLFFIRRDGAVLGMNNQDAASPDILESYTGPVSAVSWQSQERIQVLYSNAFLSTWDLSAGQLERMQPVYLKSQDFEEPIYSLPMKNDEGRFLAWSPNGKRVLLGLDADAAIIDAESGLEKVRLTGHAAQVVQGAFSPDGRQVVTADRTARVRVWNSASGSQARVHEPVTIGAAITGLGWLPASAADPASSPSLAVTWLNSARYALDLVDPVTGQDHRISGIKESLGKVAGSPDGRWVASVVGKGVMVWDARSRQLRWTLPLDPADWRSISMAVSPDGRYLATGGIYISVWDMNSGKKVSNFTSRSGHATALAFSPDGGFLVSGSAGGTLYLWALTPQPAQIN